jgi:hypothetical protein
MSYGHIAAEYRRRTRDLHKADRMSMEAILHQYGFPKSAAGKLVKEGMGPHELIQRAKLPATGPGGLTWTHRIKQTRNRGVQSLSKTKKEQRLARIERAVLKIINSTPLNEPFVDNPIYKRLMKERDNLLGI